MQGRKSRRQHRLNAASSTFLGYRFHLAAFEPLEERRLLASTPELLADLSGQEYKPTQNLESAGVGELFFFSAVRNLEQLWRSDGTAAGTFQLTVDGSRYPSYPRSLYDAGGKLIFWAYDGTPDRKLWVSDGTPEGTHVVQRPGLPTKYESYQGLKTPTSSFVLFTALEGNWNRTLWRTDGTTSGTYKLKTLTSHALDTVSEMWVVNEKAYFTTYVNGRVSLWQTDGTSTGTYETFVPLTNAQAPVAIWDHAGLQYFLVNAGTKYNVWRSNGTAAGTEVIAQLPTLISIEWPMDSQALGGDLYFVARTSTSGTELFKFDLETATFSMVADFYIGTGSSAPRELTVVGDSLYFVGSFAPNSDVIWRTDGTTAGTVAVGYGDSGAPYHGASRLMNFGGTLLFNALDDEHGTAKPELWKSDGTDAGTVLIKDINPGQAGLQFGAYGVAGGRLFFVDYTNPDGIALRVTDGTGEGTQLVRILSPNSSFDVKPADYLYFGNTTYVATEIGVWAIPDGGSAVRLTTQRSYHLVEAGGQIYFLMFVDEKVQHIMVTDGTVARTRSLRFNGLTDRASFWMNEFQGRLYFSDDHDLWTSDGTPEGTQLVKQIPADRPWGFSYITVVNDKLYFTAGGASPIRKDELWVSDGTPDGTMEIDVPFLELPGLLTAVGDLLYFTTYNSTYGEELWVSDGTVAGTRMVKDIRPGFSSGIPAQMSDLGGRLYFVADTGSGEALWTSDGTEAGTQVVVPPTTSTTDFGELIAVGDALYYTIRDKWYDDVGMWLIKYGQSEPLQLIDYGTTKNSSRNLTNVNGALYFTVGTPGGRAELWRSDGTVEGTGPVPVSTLPPDADPDYLADVGGSLIFIADSPTGRDPWILRVPSQVVGRHLFYNDSAFDGGDAAANAADDGAIAPDKIAYQPGTGLSTTASVSSYSRGINGLMIDIAGLEGELTADDFIFRVGMNGASESWELAPAPLEIVVRAGEGPGGSDRVTITWASGAIKNTWLQVVVKGNDAVGAFNTNTGLAEGDVFYFGSRVGDTFEGATALSTATNARDELAARFAPGIAQAIDSLWDFNRDGMVNAADALIARNNGGMLLMLEVDALAEELAARQLVSISGVGDDRAVLGQSALAFALALGDDDARGEEFTHDAWRGRKR